MVRPKGSAGRNVYPDYDSRTEFSLFIMRKGTEFEAAIVGCPSTLIPLCTIGSQPAQSRSLEAADEIFAPMDCGEPAIYQAVLRGAESRTHGTSDLLIRSDVLGELVAAAITAEVAAIPARDLWALWPDPNTGERSPS